MTQNVNQTITELRQTTTEAALHFDIWWVFKSDDSRPEFVDTMNRYNLFFQASSLANFVALLVNLYRIYETRNDTHNIPDLLNTLRVQQTISQKDLAEIDDVYRNQAKPLWKKVTVLRNKVFGHRATSLNTRDAFQQAGVTANELQDLVEFTKTILNKLSSAIDHSVHAFNLRACEDTLQVLKDLKMARSG